MNKDKIKQDLKIQFESLGKNISEYEKYVDVFLELALDQNKYFSNQELMDWFKNLREKCTIKLKEKEVKDLKDWKILDSGEIVHNSGGFYSIIGVEVNSAQREVKSWDQPMIYQKEMGILGIITTLKDGIRYYILHAKAEPGNIYKLQLSPTLQATFSNLGLVHGGKKTLFANYFDNLESKKVLYKQWLAEDGGRFYLKSNLNVLLDVPDFDFSTLTNEYRPFTFSQIKDFLRFDQLINPHVRSILCHL